jgi:hypothetical protein
MELKRRLRIGDICIVKIENTTPHMGIVLSIHDNGLSSCCTITSKSILPKMLEISAENTFGSLEHPSFIYPFPILVPTEQLEKKWIGVIDSEQQLEKIKTFIVKTVKAFI